MKATLRVLREVIVLSYRAYPLGAAVLQVLAVLSAVAVAVTAAVQRWIVDSAGEERIGGLVLAAALGAVALAVQYVGRAGSSSVWGEIMERVELVMTRRILTMSSSLPTTEHLVRPDYLDRISILRRGVQALASSGTAAMDMAVSLVSLLLSVTLLFSVHPVLGLLAFFGLPPLLVTTRTHRLARRAAEATAEDVRREERLHELCVQPEPAKEIHIAGSGPALNASANELWRRAGAVELRAKIRGAIWELAGWAVFAAGFVAAVAFTASLALSGSATVGDIVLVITLATQLRGQVYVTVHNAGRLAEAGHVMRHYIWLQEYTAGQRSGVRQAPATLTQGITLRGVGFTYPGTEREVLRGIDLDLPAGSTVGLVGVNGAGKSTLVKLLTGMHLPTSGTISVEGVPMDELDLTQWRSRASGSFQDFVKFQFRARETVGVGDISRDFATDAVRAAVDRAGASSAVALLPGGLDAQLGRVYDGAELSHGEWQKLALARGLMRETPLLMVLDEPTAALDPQAEHDLFERFIASARTAAAAHGAITVLVSHRFSTVHMADHIVVIADGGVAEQGTHEELMARNGTYAGLYTLQANAYTLDK